MTQILKRLEIIKSSIAIDDEEIIDLQIMKLKKLDLNEEVAQIVVLLEQSDFTTALSFIEAYLSRYSGVVKYIDTQLQGLKLQLKTLESKLQELIEQKTEYLSVIAEFNNEYNLRLGELIRSILSLRKEILYKKTIKQQKEKEKYKEDIQAFEETIQTVEELRSTVLELEEILKHIDDSHEQYDEIQASYKDLLEELGRLEDEIKTQQEELEKAKEFIDDEALQHEYQESKNHYDEFDNNYEDIKESIKNSMALNEEEKALLKTLYKKAARLCHPDIVPDEQKEKAHELMQQLNDAYSKKEILKVKEILNLLENGSWFKLSSDSIDDKEILKAKIDECKQNIKEIENELEALEEDETYQIIAELDDWDEYFEELKSELFKEKERLEEEAMEFLEEINEEFSLAFMAEEADTWDVFFDDEFEAPKTQTIIKESSQYIKDINSTENIKFERIRKHCENLSKAKEADEMQKRLGEQGKMHKALIYSSLEVFIENLNGETITLCDWGCDQGIASMLVLDYIKEKQLDIKVSDVILVDDDMKVLSRAIAQVEALAQETTKTIAIKSDDNNLLDKIKSTKNNTTLHLFANDNIPIDFLVSELDIFEKSFVLCVSNEKREFVDEVYENFKAFMAVHDLSILNGKIGRFDKFERIFFIEDVHL